ncbi:TPA: hypothetical protein SMN64_000254 [Proteus mirabilis]|nr:hypothetical protein [Proteus mirabilis]
MTVSTELSHEEYIGNGVTTDFDFRFRIFEGKHLIVVVADSDGNEKTLKNGTDYTIVGAGSYHGGKVVLNKPLAQGWKILLERDLPVVQETDLRNQGKFFAEVHEDAFDYLTMLIQKALGTFSLSLRKPTYLSNYYDAKGNRIANLAPPKLGTDSANKDYVDNSIKDIDSKTLRVKDKPINALPNTEQRANKILAFDDNGQPITVLPESGSASDVLMDLLKGNGANNIKWRNHLVGERLDKIAYSDDFDTLKEWAEFPAEKKVFVSGSYVLDETLNIQCDELLTDGTVKIKMNTATPAIVIGDSERILLDTASVEIKKGQTFLSINDASNLFIGDVIFLWNPRDFSYSNHRYYYRQGEAVTIADVGTSRIILTGGIFDTYPAGTKLIKPKMEKKKISGDFIIEFPQLDGEHTYSPESVGLLCIQLHDSDFSGLSIKTKQASQSFILRRCVNCYGNGINNSQVIFGEATLGLDSGLGIANCQSISFKGRFSGERHGVSISGNHEEGSIVNRFCDISGEILSTSKDSKLAADWHGNAEYCSYEGRIQGVTAGGNHNSIKSGSIIESLGDPNGRNISEPTIGFREMSGCDFSFSNIYIKSINKPSLNYRGVIDLGSISSQLNSKVLSGGTINFSNSIIECENTEHAIKIRSDSFDLWWGINLTGLQIKKAGQRPIWIESSKGKQADSVIITGLIPNKNATEIVIKSENNKYDYSFSGVASLVLKKGSSSEQVFIKTPIVLMPYYIIITTVDMIYGKEVKAYCDIKRANEFRLTAKTIDGLPISQESDIEIKINYIAML